MEYLYNYPNPAAEYPYSEADTSGNSTTTVSIHDYNKLLDKFKELEDLFHELLSPPNTVPMDGMPWNIPGGVHSPEAIPAREYVDREMVYNMTQREDLLSSD